MQLKGRAERIELWPLERLVPYDRNPRTHSPEQIDQIAASMIEFGFTSPLLVDGSAGIIAGHGRLEAAQKLGLSEVPVIVLDHLSPAQRRAYLIADNRLALNAAWDDRLLVGELHALNGDGFDLGLLGFSDAELDDLMAPLEEYQEGDKQTKESGAGNEEEDDAADEVPETPRDPITQSGDLWCLGGHKLLCADSTDAAAVQRLMVGDEAALCFTSPPYANQRDYASGGVGDWDQLMRGVFGHLPMAPNGQILVNLGLTHHDGEWQSYWDAWIGWMRAQGWRRFAWYVWDKLRSVPGDWGGRLGPSFEFVFHFNKVSRKPNKIVPCKNAGGYSHIRDLEGGSTALRQKDGSITKWAHAGRPIQDFKIPDATIRLISQRGPVGKGLDHPAPFPVALPQHVIESYTDEQEIVFEPFGGSGTTMLAAQRTGRRARALELAPAYVDVALIRFTRQFPDVPIVLDGDGRTFQEIAAERQPDAVLPS